MTNRKIQSKEYRQKCLSNKGKACELCGSVKDIVVHHIDGDRENQNIDNLTPLCRGCHYVIHTPHMSGSDQQLKYRRKLPDSSLFRPGGGVDSDVEGDELVGTTVYIQKSILEEMENKHIKFAIECREVIDEYMDQEITAAKESPDGDKRRKALLVRGYQRKWIKQVGLNLSKMLRGELYGRHMIP